MRAFKNHFRTCAVFLFLFSFSCFASGVGAESGGGNMMHKMTTLITQLAVIFIAAKLGGFVCSRYLKMPDVLGELGAGILIGPYALGSHIGLFSLPAAGAAMPISPELYGFATFASIILLYLAGLETDLGMFLKYSIPGTVVGVGGVIFSFILGDLLAVWFYDNITTFMDPAALFLGTISTATSVGITARILSEKNKLDSPEGTTILAGAVIDDVLGIIILAVVVGIAGAAHTAKQEAAAAHQSPAAIVETVDSHIGDNISATVGEAPKSHIEGTAIGESHEEASSEDTAGNVDWRAIGGIAAKAFGFWLIATILGMLASKRISKVLEFFGSKSTMATMSLGLACLLAGIAEHFGLAMIIGAYIMGLSMSRADSAHTLYHNLEPIYNTLVAVFFCVLGMMVNVPALLNADVIMFGLIYSVVAILAKVLGSGIPSLFMGFKPLGAFRIGIGMLPRGEVALIVAGIGLAMPGNIVTPEIFGVAIMMTLITTVIAPLVMVRIFDDRSGLKKTEDDKAEENPIALELPNAEIAVFLVERIIRMFQDEECYIHQVIPGELIYQIRKDDMTITVKYEDETLTIRASEADREYARLMLLEALASLINTFEGLRKMGNKTDMRNQLFAF